MPRRIFQLPDAHSESTSPEREGERVALVGGDLASRRKHGHPSILRGELLFDPIFQEDDLASLQQWCDPADPRPLVIEIGFQRARFAAQWCKANPDSRYLGFEVRKKFCEDANDWLLRHDVRNARLALVDARSILEELVQPGSLSLMFCFFPDPWWKKRHMKKRLVSRSFAEMGHRLLAVDGTLLVKTDVEGYADWAEEELRAVPGWTVRRLDDSRAGLPETQRERRCRLRGLPTWAIEASKSEME